MNAILNFVDYLAHWALQLMVLVVVISVIFSWLAYFNVINMRNPTVRRIEYTLDSMARPLLSPLRRFLPNMGGLDLSPLLFIVIVGGIDTYLRPPLFGWLHSLVGPPVQPI